MASAREKFHIQARRAERKALAAGSCSRFWKGAGRRAAALLLALGMVGTALAQEVAPLQVTDLAEFPTITIETNLVMNEASKEPEVVTDADGNKFGFIEVALRVTPGSSGLFSGVAVALTYDQTLLTPVTWNEFDEATQKRDKYEVVTVADPAVPYSTFLPTKKADVISSASAFIGGTDNGKTLLYLSAEAETPTKLTGDSRLAVVRFRYDATAHPLSYDGGDGGSNQIMDGATPVEFLDWAGDASAAASPAGANAYFTGKSEPTQRESMYYVHAAPNPGDAAKWPVHTTEGIAKPDTDCLQLVKAVKATGTATDPDYYSYATNFFPVDPAYIAALQTSPLPEGLPVYTGDASKLTPKIQFTQITDATADQGSGGISLDDLSTILFYDWDDTLLGALTVPKGVDVREEVNAYVRDNFIHPDLRYDKEGKEGKADLALLDNTARTNSYRGTFPHDNPGGAEGSGNSTPEDANGDGVIDAKAGSRFPLTNKLDYVFMKKPMVWNGEFSSWDEAAACDEEYPYIHGWMKSSVETLEDTWTTLGVGELGTYAEDAGTHYVEVSEKNLYAVADFTSVTDTLAAVKAVYEPGDDVVNGYYTLKEEPYYTRYTTEGSSANGTYSIQYSYQRVANGIGITRTRKPALQILYMPDMAEVNSVLDKKYKTLYEDNLAYDFIEGFNAETYFYEYYGKNVQEFQEIMGLQAVTANSFYMRGEVENKDVIAAELTPSSAILEVEYALIDEYNSSFISGLVRSAGGEIGIIRNFDYTKEPYATRQGTDGFVLKGTLGVLLEEATKEAKGEANNYLSMVALSTFEDLNFKYTRTINFTGVRVTAARNTIKNLVLEALSEPTGKYVNDRGYASLTWHQVQYALVHASDGGSLLVEDSVARNDGYDWYRGA